MKPLFALLAGLICIISLCYAQKEEPPITLRTAYNIMVYVDDNFDLGDKALKRQCIEGMTFIRFQVTREGIIRNAAFSGNVSKEIEAALRKSLSSSNGHWILSDLDKDYIEKKTFLLPVRYNFNWGCKKDVNPQLQLSNTNKKKKKEEPLFLEGYEMGNSFKNMLNFHDEHLNSLECIILAPLNMIRLEYY